MLIFGGEGDEGDGDDQQDQVCYLWVEVDIINGNDGDDDDDDDDDDNDDDDKEQVRCLRGRGWGGFPHSRRGCVLQQGPTLPSILLLLYSLKPMPLSSQFSLYAAPCLKSFFFPVLHEIC